MRIRMRRIEQQENGKTEREVGERRRNWKRRNDQTGDRQSTIESKSSNLYTIHYEE